MKEQDKDGIKKESKNIPLDLTGKRRRKKS